MKLPRLLIFALAFPLAVHAQTVVFNDTFGTSTLNPTTYPTPTSTSTGYEVASTKNTTSSLAAGDLKLSFPATTSGLVEAQALFTNTPIALASDGQFVRLTATFTATSNILVGGTGSSINLGLFNSFGSPPLTGGVLQTSGLSATAGSTFATGGAQLWQGYTARFAYTGGTNTIVVRPPQNGANTSSANQDVLFNNVGGGAYNNPTGTAVVTPAPTSTLALTQGSQYTMDLRVTFNSATSLLTIDANLYSGAGTAGPLLFGQTGTTTDPTLTTTFDGLAVGFRYSSTSSGANTIDFNNLLVTTGVVPEPGTTAMMVGGAGMLAGLRRFRKI